VNLRLEVFALAALVLPAVSIAADPLANAKSLAASQFSGWTYGSSAAKKQIDCVQFVLAVVAKSSPKPIGEESRKAVLISGLSAEESKPAGLAKLVEAGDERTKGVQLALVKAGVGTVVSPQDAKPGDLIQYWMKPKNGDWFGHAGVLEMVTRNGDIPEATVYGAHKSQNGIGTSKFKLKLVGDPAGRRIYLVRM
jgi:hypothetical protein